MQIKRVISLIALVANLPQAAHAAPIISAERVVASGQTQKIGYYVAVDPACHSLGPLTINLLENPHSGTVQIGHGLEYPGYSTLNTRSRCNSKKVQATQVLYTSVPGYTGSDDFTIEAIGFQGDVQRTHFHISVR